MTLILSDTFTDTNGTNLTSHTMDVGSGWTVHNGTANIQSNQLNVASVAGGLPAFTCSVNSGLSDVAVSADIIIPVVKPNAHLAIALRVLDGNNAWWVSLIPDQNLFTIFELVAGVGTLRASTAFAITGGATYTLAATVTGNTITATVNGGNQIQYASAVSGASRTLFGFRLNAAATRADNFSVSSLINLTAIVQHLNRMRRGG